MKQEILISILYDLLAGERVTLRGVAEKYGVSERTAYRYLESLSTANVPVWTERGRNGGFRLEEQYRLPAGFLTAEEADAVNDALAAVNAELGSEKLRSAMEKLKASSKNADTALTLTSGNLIIDAGHWGDASTYREKLARAEESIEKRLVVALKYHDRTGEYSERTAEPHALVFKQGLWYLYAYCRLREDFRLFKLGRIEQLRVTEENFERRPLPDKKPFSEWFGTEECVTVRFEIQKSALSDFEEWVGIEHIARRGNGFFAEVRLPDDGGLISKILSFGTGLKVLSPAPLKERVLAAARGVAGVYEEKG